MSLLLYLRQTNEVSGWCGLCMSLNFSESEIFAGEELVLGEISFLIFMSSL